MAENLPYVTSIGTFEKLLGKIKTAVVPDRFTQDFLATVIGMKGGRPQSLIPFLKKMGFLATTGEPTDLYREYKNRNKSAQAIAKAFRRLYERLYEKNEYIELASDEDVKGLIIECTGAEESARTVGQTLATFNLLRKLGDFQENELKDVSSEVPADDNGNNYPQYPNNPIQQISAPQQQTKGINLSYTINLNLPATKDVEVFHAIFKSLKKHLLEG